MTIGIVGMGSMGRGIAEVAALAGYEVVLAKATPGAVDQAKRAIAASLDRQVKKGKLTAVDVDAALSRLLLTNDLDMLSGSRIVIESIVEDLGAKQALFRDLEERVSQAAVLASNTSSLPLSALASPLAAPNRFLGAALLFAGAGHEAGGGRHHPAHLPRRRRGGAALRGAARQDPGDGRRHLRLHRQ